MVSTGDKRKIPRSLPLIDPPLTRVSTLFYRHEGTLFGPLDIGDEIRVGAARFPLTDAGLRHAVDMAPELDAGDERYGLLLVFPECGHVEGLPGVLVRDPELRELLGG